MLPIPDLVTLSSDQTYHQIPTFFSRLSQVLTALCPLTHYDIISSIILNNNCFAWHFVVANP